MNAIKTKITLQAEPRPTVEIQLPDGRIYSGPRGASLQEFLQALPEWDNPPIMGAVVNFELRELTFPIDTDARVKPVTMEDADGARIYRRSITFLLEAAFEELFPAGRLTVDHSISSGGFYCEVSGRSPLTRDEVKLLEKRMGEYVNANLPMTRHQVPLDEAIQYFRSKGYDDKVRLLKYRQKEFLILYRLRDHQDYHHGYMLPATGSLKWFKLEMMGRDGFVIQYPRRHAPSSLLRVSTNDKLLATFKRYGSWLERLGIDNVGALNDAILAGRTKEVILISEALHDLQAAEIAQKVVKQSADTRIILIAGPSSSGKTTFSKRLSVQLLAKGLSPMAIELDDYFIDREHTPKDENGEYDFESLRALNIEKLNDDLKRLINGEEVQLPRYNFKTGLSETGDRYRLEKDQMLILEGIHGLNPGLLPEIPAGRTFRIYISCLTQLNLDRYNRISTTDSRLIRRIVRDARERGYTAQQTIARWESVRRGEKQHIFPYQENADEMFNSALVYELSVLKPLVEPLLRQVQYYMCEYVEAKRLLAFLEWFQPIEPDLIPDNSLLREFVGNSILKDFKVWSSRPRIER